MAKRVAVTGGTGFVGRATLARLRKSGHHVNALTRVPRAPIRGINWIEGALDRPEALARLVADADAVIHIAGVVNAPDAAGFAAANVAGTETIVDAARAEGVRRFVHVSSLAAREPQLSDYGSSKYRGEKVVATSLLDWTVVRPPAVYGPGDMEMFEMFRLARRGLVPVPAGGRFSVIHVHDLARLLVALVEEDGESLAEIYEPDDGRRGGWTNGEFVRALGRAYDRRAIALPLPAFLLRLGARIDMAVRGKRAKLTLDRARYFSHPDWTVDSRSRPPADLWRPEIGTESGLRMTAKWYREQGWLPRRKLTTDK